MTTNTGDLSNIEEDKCIICLEEISIRDWVICTCKHIFHGDCYEKQLSYKDSCPLCRGKLSVLKQIKVSDENNSLDSIWAGLERSNDDSNEEVALEDDQESFDNAFFDQINFFHDQLISSMIDDAIEDFHNADLQEDHLNRLEILSSYLEHHEMSKSAEHIAKLGELLFAAASHSHIHIREMIISAIFTQAQNTDEIEQIVIGSNCEDQLYVTVRPFILARQAEFTN